MRERRRHQLLPIIRFYKQVVLDYRGTGGQAPVPRSADVCVSRKCPSGSQLWEHVAPLQLQLNSSQQQRYTPQKMQRCMTFTFPPSCAVGLLSLLCGEARGTTVLAELMDYIYIYIYTQTYKYIFPPFSRNVARHFNMLLFLKCT